MLWRIVMMIMVMAARTCRCIRSHWSISSAPSSKFCHFQSLDRFILRHFSMLKNRSNVYTFCLHLGSEPCTVRASAAYWRLWESYRRLDPHKLSLPWAFEALLSSIVSLVKYVSLAQEYCSWTCIVCITETFWILLERYS